MKKGPQYHSSHRKEESSKREFQKLIEPCVINWTQRDYGLDGLVTLPLKSDASGSVDLDSMHFLIQLKSTTSIKQNQHSFTLPIEVRHIKDWVKSNISVMLVVGDLVNGLFYCKWMDNQFVNELAKTNTDWITKTKIGVKFGKQEQIKRSFVDSAKSYLLSQVKNQSVILPGQYFTLRDQVKLLLEGFKKITSTHGFESMKKIIEVLSEKIDLAIYRIAVAGPSRAGKSTLINALLKKNISPIGIYQTTGVPIQIIPGTKNEVIVYFKDNTKQVGKFSIDLIAKYAAQTRDLSKLKNTKIVCVSLVNSALEKGFSIFDVPGLDDPDDEILQHTLSYVKTFNAIIYLIDVTPHKTGGFAFKSEFKRQLEEMTSRLDKVFLVFNKIDSLTPKQLESLKDRIHYDLKRLDLAEKVDSKIHFVSARKSYEASLKGKSIADDSISTLEKSLWTYLLEGNKAGVYRLLDITREIYGAYNTFADILNARLLDSEKLDDLHLAIEQIQKKLPELKSMLKVKQHHTIEKLRLFLESEKNELILKLEKKLLAIPLQDSFLKDADIKHFLVSEVDGVITRANEICLEQINLYKNDLDIWIESNLRRIREIISSNTQSKIPDLSPIETMVVPSIDFSAAFGMGILGGIIAVIVNPYAAIGTILGSAAVGFLGLLFLTQETRRAKKIKKAIESARSRCDTVFEDLKAKFGQGVVELCITVHNYGDEKISLYFSDIAVQIQKITNQRLSDQEKREYQLCFEQINQQEIELEKTVNEIIRYK